MEILKVVDAHIFDKLDCAWLESKLPPQNTQVLINSLDEGIDHHFMEEGQMVIVIHIDKNEVSGFSPEDLNHFILNKILEYWILI